MVGSNCSPSAPPLNPRNRMSRLATDNLAELICKKHQLLVQLREVGCKQGALVERGNSQSLLQLLSAKQHLINGLQLVERHLRPYHAEDPNDRLWRSQEDRQRCADLSDECRLLLAEVVEMERDQERRIQEHRNALAGQLQQAGKAQKVVDAYRQHRADPPPAQVPLSALGSTAGTTRLDPGLPLR